MAYKKIAGNIHYFIACGGFGLSCSVLAHDYYFLSHFQEQEAESSPAPLDRDTLQLISKVLDLAEVNRMFRKYVNYFTCKRSEVISKGSPLFTGGIQIGVPSCFQYKSADEIQSNTFSFYDKKINLDEQLGQQIADSIVYSENEKKFALAHEIFHGYSFLSYLQMSVPFLAIVTWYSIGHCAFNNPVLNLRRQIKLPYRWLIYSIGCVIGLKLTLSARNTCLQYQEKYTLQKIAKVDENLAKAGVTYYEKCINRNKILYSIPQANFKDRFHADGNLVYPVYDQYMPLTSRKSYLVQLLKEKGVEI